MQNYNVNIELSGDRFSVTYILSGEEDVARIIAKHICVEQTVEFPEELLPDGDIRRHIVGRIESFTALGHDKWKTEISFANETSGFELPQLLNNIFGNISLEPGIRVDNLSLSAKFLSCFRGPRFGREGIRTLVRVPHRPLLSTALKPMGLPPAELADLAYQFALGGIDIIKDDHGLANQPFSTWSERVHRCTEAVARANAQTGYSSIYMPNVTAPANVIEKFAYQAKSIGVGGLLIAPGLTGFDIVRQLASDANLRLPLMSHPAFLGSFVTDPFSGISHRVLFGQMMRLAGADATVYPNHGGRFSFTEDACRSIVEGATTPMGHIAPIFPTPGGGMTQERIPEMIKMYGREAIFLIGGGLFKGVGNITENSKRLLNVVTEACVNL